MERNEALRPERRGPNAPHNPPCVDIVRPPRGSRIPGIGPAVMPTQPHFKSLEKQTDRYVCQESLPLHFADHGADSGQHGSLDSNVGIVPGS